MKPKILVILASTRQSRAGEGIAQWVMSELTKRSDAEYELVDLRDWKLPYFDYATPASLLTEYDTDIEKQWASKVDSADGYIVVTAEYNHSMPAVLKSALDLPYKQWNNKPIAYVSYGSAAGGSRAVEQLRLIAVEQQMAPIRSAVHIKNIWEAFGEDGKLKDEQSYQHALITLADQLAWWTGALKTARVSTK